MFDMKKQLMWSKLKVGLVVTAALLTLFLTVFFAGGIQFLFSPKVEIKAQIADVKGLRKGAPVWLSGIEIGSVKDIRLNPGYGTTVTLSINKSALDYLKKDSHASVLTMGLLGDKYVELGGGSPEAEKLAAGDTIAGASQIELKDVMEVGTSSIQNMTNFLKKLDHIVTEIENGQGTASKLLKDPSLYNNLDNASLRLSKILARVEKGERGLVTNKDTDKEMKETIEELRQLIKDIKAHPKKYFKFSVF